MLAPPGGKRDGREYWQRFSYAKTIVRNQQKVQEIHGEGFVTFPCFLRPYPWGYGKTLIAQARGAAFVSEATGSIAGRKEIAEQYSMSQAT